MNEHRLATITLRMAGYEHVTEVRAVSEPTAEELKDPAFVANLKFELELAMASTARNAIERATKE